MIENISLFLFFCSTFSIYNTENSCFFNELQCDENIILQASPVFTFANQAGLDMLETTLVALQDIMLDKILDEAGRKILCSEFSKIMQQVVLHILDYK